MFSQDQILSLMRERVHHPAGSRELLQLLRIPKDERAAFRRHLKALVAAGELVQIRGHRFGLPEKMDLHVGRLETHPGGFGFVVPERRLEEGDIYISPQNLNDAVNGDRVVARIERIKEGGRAEGRVMRVLERGRPRLVGRFERDGDGRGRLVSFDRHMLIDVTVPRGEERGANDGEMVVIEITRWPSPTRGALGRVTRVLGDIDAPGVDTEIIIGKFGIPDAHSD